MKIEDIKQYEMIKDSFYDRCKEIAKIYIEKDLKFNVGKNWGIHEFDFHEKKMYITVDESWAYGGYDTHSITLDLETFVSDNFEEIINAQIEESNKKHLELQEEKKEKERLKKIEEARKILEELDKK